MGAPMINIHTRIADHAQQVVVAADTAASTGPARRDLRKEECLLRARLLDFQARFAQHPFVAVPAGRQLSTSKNMFHILEELDLLEANALNTLEHDGQGIELGKRLVKLEHVIEPPATSAQDHMAAFTLLSSELDGFRSELIEIVAAGTRPKAPQNAETLKEEWKDAAAMQEIALKRFKVGVGKRKGAEDQGRGPAKRSCPGPEALCSDSPGSEYAQALETEAPMADSQVGAIPPGASSADTLSLSDILQAVQCNPENGVDWTELITWEPSDWVLPWQESAAASAAKGPVTALPHEMGEAIAAVHAAGSREASHMFLMLGSGGADADGGTGIPLVGGPQTPPGVGSAAAPVVTLAFGAHLAAGTNPSISSASGHSQRNGTQPGHAVAEEARAQLPTAANGAAMGSDLFQWPVPCAAVPALDALEFHFEAAAAEERGRSPHSKPQDEALEALLSSASISPTGLGQCTAPSSPASKAEAQSKHAATAKPAPIKVTLRGMLQQRLQKPAYARKPPGQQAQPSRGPAADMPYTAGINSHPWKESRAAADAAGWEWQAQHARSRRRAATEAAARIAKAAGAMGGSQGRAFMAINGRENGRTALDSGGDSGWTPQEMGSSSGTSEGQSRKRPLKRLPARTGRNAAPGGTGVTAWLHAVACPPHNRDVWASASAEENAALWGGLPSMAELAPSAAQWQQWGCNEVSAAVPEPPPLAMEHAAAQPAVSPELVLQFTGNPPRIYEAPPESRSTGASSVRLKPLSEVHLMAANVQAAPPVSGAQMQAFPKRKRGRPKKGCSVATRSYVGPPRKRGRPKVQIERPKKRGRPKKVRDEAQLFQGAPMTGAAIF